MRYAYITPTCSGYVHATSDDQAARFIAICLAYTHVHSLADLLARCEASRERIDIFDEDDIIARVRFPNAAGPGSVDTLGHRGGPATLGTLVPS